MAFDNQSGFDNNAVTITSKGDLIVGDATGRPMRLAVGADGLVLTADSTQTSGVAWTAIGARPTTFFAGTSFVYDDTVAAAQAIFGRALKTGLATGNSQAVLHVSASSAANVNDATHDFNVGAFVENYTANGAGLVVLNAAKGDGVYIQTADTTGDGVTAGQTSWALNVTTGTSTNTAAVGDAVHIQRWGAGAAISITTTGAAGTGSSRALQSDITVNHGAGANAGYLALTDNGGTSADSVALTRTAVTTGKFINIFQSSSTYAGDALFMNLGKGGGSFIGNFLHLATNDSDRLTFDKNGTMTITAAGGANPLLIKIGSTTSSFFNANGALSTIQSIIMNGPATTPGLSFAPTAAQSVPCMSFNANVLTATTATAGTNGAAPALVDSYLLVSVNGVTKKIPMYLN